VPVAVTDHEDQLRAGEVGLEPVEQADELLPHHEHLGRRVVDDERGLRRCEPPVHGDQHRVELRRAEQHLEVLEAVLVEDRDAVARADAHGAQLLGDAVRPLVQLCVRDGAVAEQVGRRVRRCRRVHPHHVGDVGELGHQEPRRSGPVAIGSDEKPRM
jgi:hypothetical protein